MENRWTINRAGLVNFWYYDDEVFDFAGGRLLLRGANGSGKSVTMQSFIPLLLDGNKSPERLDPFGSRARKLEDYLLGEQEINDIDERTGYIFMEFKRKNSDNYITIGMGLKARRGQNMDFWGFILLDGRRVGLDFSLYKYEVGFDGKKQKVPLSKRELKNKILPGGEFAEGQKEYMQMVNKYIFGFDLVDEYDELIKLLVQLRSPKLSKDFKPTVIYDIMNGALPALSDEDLRPLSEAIENMDEIKMHLDELYRSQKAASRLKKEYDNYNRFILYEKAELLLKSYEELTAIQKNNDGLKNEIEIQRETITQLSSQIQDLEHEQQALKQKEDNLRENDAFKAHKTLLQEEQSLKELRQSLQQKNKQFEDKKTRQDRLDNNIKSSKQEKESIDLKIEQLLDDMDKTAVAIDFMEHVFSKDELKKCYGKKFDFKFWDSEVQKHTSKIKKALEVLKKEHEQNQRYNRSLQERDELEKERMRLDKEALEWERQFNDIKGEYIQSVHQWTQNNTELMLENDSLEAIARFVWNYGESTGYDDILKEVRTAFQKRYNLLQRELTKQQNERDRVKTLYDEKKAELKEWQDKKDPEPERNPQVVVNRQRLTEKKIPHIPFYQAVEFKKDITEEIRGKIEAALEDMGLLDALIVPKNHLDEAMTMDKNMCDRYIIPGVFNMKLSVFEFFDIPSLDGEGVLPETVDDVLRNILVYNDDNATYVTHDGTYGIGVLKGKGRDGVKSRFIGFESRKRYREDMIRILTEELDVVGNQISKFDENIRSINQQLENLHQEFSKFPPSDDLEEAFKSYKMASLKLQNAVDNLEKKEQEVKVLFDELQKIRIQAESLTSGINIPRDLTVYQDAESNMTDYTKSLGQLEINYNKMMSHVEKISILIQDRDDLEIDLENLAAEIQALQNRQKGLIARIKALKETIESFGFKKIKEELESLVQRLSVIPNQILNAVGQKENTSGKMEGNIKRREELKIKIDGLKKVFAVYKRGFKDELELAFVNDLSQDMNIDLSDDEKLAKLCRSIVKNIFPSNKRTDVDRETLTTRLVDAFYENHSELLIYGLSIGYLFDDIVDGLDRAELEAAKKMRRHQITANLRGKVVSLYALHSAIEKDIADNESLLRETDRQLFEEIIMHNVGKKIRAKIYRAEGWVKKMNKLMSERDTSSGITFSLAWRPIPAQNEQELDTRELVDILKSGAQMLKPDDFTRVTEHFRSKVDSARKLMDDTENMETFHHIIKGILDYRKWFEFKLYYRKDGEVRRELTNNAFDKLSGGEKAMAMYIPLFSAVYARYESAAAHAPRVISLDEAFAGVDDMNIRDMFKLMEDLSFNFVLNSQVLWGDYDTVPELSICELVRPKNANFVTVIRYLWDGQKRMIIYDTNTKIAASGE